MYINKEFGLYYNEYIRDAFQEWIHEKGWNKHSSSSESYTDPTGLTSHSHFSKDSGSTELFHKKSLGSIITNYNSELKQRIGIYFYA